MPYNADENTFSRALRFVDDREAGDEVTRSDLDAVLDDLAVGVNAALNQVINFVGDWNAASGVFPTTRPDGSAIRRRDAWRVSVSGTTGGVVFEENETLLALVTAPATTYSRNWLRLPSVASSIVNTILAEVQAAADDVAATAETVATTAAAVEADRIAAEAAADAAEAAIPAPTGQAGKMIRVKADGSGYETRTPEQVLTDIGIPDATANGSKMLRVKADASGYELRSSSQVKDDLGLGTMALVNTAAVGVGAASVAVATSYDADLDGGLYFMSNSATGRPADEYAGVVQFPADVDASKMQLAVTTTRRVFVRDNAGVAEELAKASAIAAAIAAYTPTTSQVLAAAAGATLGAVGTDALLKQTSTTGGTITAGSTLSGSNLSYACISSGGGISTISGSPSGTWRLMAGGYSGGDASTATWRRIS